MSSFRAERAAPLVGWGNSMWVDVLSPRPEFGENPSCVFSRSSSFWLEFGWCEGAHRHLTSSCMVRSWSSEALTTSRLSHLHNGRNGDYCDCCRRRHLTLRISWVTQVSWSGSPRVTYLTVALGLITYRRWFEERVILTTTELRRVDIEIMTKQLCKMKWGTTDWIRILVHCYLIRT